MTMDDEQRGDATIADLAAETGAANVATLDSVLEGSSPGAQGPEINEQLIAIVEALVFASPEPVTLKAMTKLLVEVANGYQIVTRPELHDWVRRMFHERTTQKLSVQALETLAVIAYKQPITAAEITEIRGVNTSGVIGTLLERGLIKISGRKQVVGRPFLSSTTRDFLDRFGLRDVHDLPKVEDMADALGFEGPVGSAAAAAQPGDEPATAEDAAVVAGETGESEDV